MKEGDQITLNGSTGEVFKSELGLIKPVLPKQYNTLLKWADEIRTMKVRTNVDTPYDAENAITLGAEGIGLCRTEHMFFDTPQRRLAIQKMILSSGVADRRAALAEILPLQKMDFLGIFKAMNGRPVTIRLLDPPLHEFVPHSEKGPKTTREKLRPLV